MDNQTDWDRVKTLFQQALAEPEYQRPEFLRLACGSDTHMALLLSSLLSHHVDASVPDQTPTTTRVFEDGAMASGRLRIVRFIAAGCMGEVYECYDEVLARKLALKTIRLHLTHLDDTSERFLREVSVAREVAHRNLCRVYDFFEHQIIERETGKSRNIPCLTMELVEGESLASRLERMRPMNCKDSLPVIRQIVAGLSELHERGIIHRDLKPSNIMVADETDGLRVVLMDFGLAKPAKDKGDFFETRMDLYAGPPYFIAPEILRGSRPSKASDIYSLGVLIDEMVTR